MFRVQITEFRVQMRQGSLRIPWIEWGSGGWFRCGNADVAFQFAEPSGVRIQRDIGSRCSVGTPHGASARRSVKVRRGRTAKIIIAQKERIVNRSGDGIAPPESGASGDEPMDCFESWQRIARLSGPTAYRSFVALRMTRGSMADCQVSATLHGEIYSTVPLRKVGKQSSGLAFPSGDGRFARHLRCCERPENSPVDLPSPLGMVARTAGRMRPPSRTGRQAPGRWPA